MASDSRSAASPSHDYVLAALKVNGQRKHIISGRLYQRGNFQTECGLLGNRHEWFTGQMRTDAGGWCRNCLRSFGAGADA